MSTHAELGTFSFCYRSLGVHGLGISTSSNFAVLYEASQQFLKRRAPLCLADVAAAALRFERRLASGLAIAADDVYPITFGGIVEVQTTPRSRNGDSVEEGQVTVQPVSCDPQWIARHVVVAMNPRGERHDVPDLLKRLFLHPEAGRFVDTFSKLAELASRAITNADVQKLAGAVNEYRRGFDVWSAGAYTSVVKEIGERLDDQLPLKVLGWKPPGAGASESMIVILRDADCRSAVERFFGDRGWTTIPAYVTSGVCGEFMKGDGEVRITAGHRLDFVGAADLGQDLAIGRRGISCSCAIEPRTEIVLSNR